ncbi:MAG: mechanosensitive ion channel domain-containing protein [Candidatus Ranarchaeia archaeon]
MQLLVNPNEIIVFLEQRWFELIIIVVVWVILLIISRLTKRNLRHQAIESGIGPDAMNGIVLAIRLGLLYIGIFTSFSVFPEFFEAFNNVWNGMSLLFGTAIGLAIGQAVSNLVSGLYIISTHPFGIGDYVRIGNKEGIIHEINLNYTKILQQDGTNALIPNNKVLSSDVVNFAYDKDKLLVEEEKIGSGDSNRWSVLRRISQIIEKEKVVRYVFTMAFPISNNITNLDKVFNDVAQNWTDKFGFCPLYELSDVSHVAFTYLFTIFTNDPRKILKNKSQFMKDIIRRIYSS